MIKQLLHLPFLYYKKFRKKALIPFAVILVLSLAAIPFLRINSDINTGLSENNQWLKGLKEFSQRFSSRAFIIAAYDTDEPFSEESLEKLGNLQKGFLEVEGVESTSSVLDFIQSETGKTNLSESVKKIVNESTLLNSLFMGINKKAWAMYITPDPEYDKTKTAQAILDKAEEMGLPNGRVFGYSVIKAISQHYVRRDFALLFTLALIFILIVQIFLSKSLRGGFFLWINSIFPALCVLALFPLFNMDLRIETVIVPVEIIALSTSYGIHFYRYYQVHVDQGIGNALLHATPIISLAGFTTILGFSSLLFNPLPILRTMSLFLMFGIFFSIICAMFMLPALASLAPEPKKRKKLREWAFNPLLRKIFAVIFLVILAFVPIFGMGKIAWDFRPQLVFLPDSQPYKTCAYFDDNFGGFSELEVFIDTEEEYGIVSPNFFNKLENIKQDLLTIDGVNQVFSIADPLLFMEKQMGWEEGSTFKDMESIGGSLEMLSSVQEGFDIGNLIDPSWRYSRILIRFGKPNLSAMEFQQMYDKILAKSQNIIRNKLQYKSRLAEQIPNKTISRIVEENSHHPLYIGGIPKQRAEFIKILIEGQIWGVALFFPLLFALLLIIFRSVKWAIAGTLPTVLSVLFYFGLIGILQMPLSVVVSLGVAILMGVSVDDVIFLIMTTRQEAKNGTANEAIHSALKKTGAAMLQTTLAIILVSVALLFSSYQILINASILTSVSLFFCTLFVLSALPILMRWIITSQKKKSGV